MQYRPSARSIFPLVCRALHRANEQAPHLWPAILRVPLDDANDTLDLAGRDVVLEVDIHQDRDLVGRRVEREDVADADNARHVAGELAQVLDELGVGRPLDS